MSEEQIDLLEWLAAHPPGASEVVLSGEGATEDQGVAPVLLRRADPACNMHRFYSLELATSLFGECGVVRHWGRIGTSGRSRTDWFNEPQEAEAAFLLLLRAKRRRGYAEVRRLHEVDRLDPSAIAPRLGIARSSVYRFLPGPGEKALDDEEER